MSYFGSQEVSAASAKALAQGLGAALGLGTGLGLGLGPGLALAPAPATVLAPVPVLRPVVARREMWVIGDDDEEEGEGVVGGQGKDQEEGDCQVCHVLSHDLFHRLLTFLIVVYCCRCRLCLCGCCVC